MNIAAWLRELGLERPESAFRDNDTDAKFLPKLTAEDLTSIGVASVDHRRKLLEAIAARRHARRDPAGSSSLAYDQRAKTFQLRAAIGLARLWRDQGKRTQARELLPGLPLVHGGFRHL